ncbi:zinc finger protein 254 [Drosophila busckii]|uniref:zinc finger protein 254 n=1 Tax=Drosophila busckii TaxID=30019 RepID=UPI0014330C70|nr:zinc finger protein 254 [Drosophila busckii]
MLIGMATIEAIEQQATATNTNWTLWCRLCAKDDTNNINVFLKNEQLNTGEREPVSDMALATAIGKYFWVTITRGEELPQMICSECLTLVTTLVNFSERITRVQKLYCLLQSMPKEAINMQEMRARFGLLEETQPETLTEVHYVEEKPKLQELEEAPLDLENPLEKLLESLADEEVLEEKEEEEEDEAERDQEQIFEDNHSVQTTDEGSEPEQQQECKSTENSHQCEQCSESFARLSSLQRHVRQEHKSKPQSSKLHSCDQCDKQFRLRSNLQRHLQQHLPMPKRKLYPCTSCDKQFTTLASAQSHAQYIHQEERPRPVMCEQCGIAVHSLSALKEHLLCHTDDTPFECDVCQKRFKSSNRLKHHKETHDPRKYICPECGKELNSRPTLNRHRLVHTDQMQHKCDYCGREFKRAKALKNHLILHTGLKPYSCDFCERTFANGSNCRTHKKKAHAAELAAQEAAGGGKTYNRNIPKLEALKAFTKNKDNLSPVATKQSGCFAFGKKPKPTTKPISTPTAPSIPTIDNFYNHI